MGIILMLQLGIISQLPLLQGTADLILLVLVAWALQDQVTSAWEWGILGGVMVSLVTATPFYVVIFSYLLVILIARMARRRIWQMPLLVMLILTFLGTLVFHLVSIVVFQIMGSNLPLRESLTLVTLPSALLNLLLAFPVYTIVADLAKWLYPTELEV
ncbi:MAG TPA: rod shape-determining protein MreD [Anaerolineaceae bacterium]|nr:rod shape-determining protein MreD [Chloroflexota bacterium]HNS62874.1 rod shape-determining protein MreD [Anaerolineaceae bacterium]HNZ00317.1 rod shape-determining protein MreD [Anaerolineaceae bacterium]HOD44580.1 rod shape-determining protein MreD [Anaerolineaceae bacterium]HOH19659.1 rod shape-determining protein MreD [Anaerolineaceae bacterium]